MYLKGGLIAVTSRILVVDMLQNDIPVDKITGILVLHAEKSVLCICEVSVLLMLMVYIGCPHFIWSPSLLGCIARRIPMGS